MNEKYERKGRRKEMKAEGEGKRKMAKNKKGKMERIRNKRERK